MSLAGVPVTTRAACVWVYVAPKSQVARCQTLNLIVRKGIMTRFLFGDKLYFSTLGSATTPDPPLSPPPILTFIFPSQGQGVAGIMVGGACRNGERKSGAACARLDPPQYAW